MIRRDETLWEIALRAKPEETSVHQTMLDIQRLNPAAFIDGNINRIKAGYIIYLPSASDISSDNFSAAQEEVRQQNQDWRDGVVRESPVAGPSLRISADSTAEDLSTGNDAEGPVTSTSASVGGVLEDAERERVDLAERVIAMEQQVETLERIVSLKDDQIAALQAALTEADPTVAADMPELLVDV